MELSFTICFTICLFISPDLDGHRAPKMNEWGWRVEIQGGRGTGTCFGAGVMRVAD